MIKIKKIFNCFICIILIVFLGSCIFEEKYTLSVNKEADFVIGIGDTSIDYTKYFIIKDSKDNNIVVQKSMLNLSEVDVSKEGSFKVILTFKEQSVKATFTVIDNTTKLLELEITSVAFVYVGETLQLTYTTKPAGLNVTVEYVSADDSIATVSKTGLVTGVKTGDVEMYLLSGTVNALVLIHVLPKAGVLTGLDILNSQDLEISKTLQLGFITTPVGLEVPLTWSSSDETIATVSQTGLVSGVKEGAVIITLSSGSISNTVVINIIKPAPVLIGLSIMNSKHIKEEETLQLTYITNPAGLDVNVTWKSSDESVATVTQNGLVTGISAGNTVIMLSCQDILAYVSINVSKESKTITSIKINNSKDLKLNEQLQLTYTTTPALEVSVNWESSNQSVVSITSSGLIKGLKVGTSIISCTYNDIKTYVTISVTPEIVNISPVLSKYTNKQKWNFSIVYEKYSQSYLSEKIEYSFDKLNTKIVVGSPPASYTDYILTSNDKYYYCYDIGKGIYRIFDDTTQEFITLTNSIELLDLSILDSYQYGKSGNYYFAVNPQTAAEGLFGYREDQIYKSLNIYIDKELITKIVVETMYQDTSYEYVLTIKNYNEVVINPAEFIDDDAKQLRELIINSFELTVGESIELTYETVPSDLSVTVEWSSSDTSICNITNGNILNGIKKGEAVITVSCLQIVCEFTINVKEAKPKLTALEINNSKNLFVGETLFLTYTTTPAEMDVTVLWESLAPDFISVTQDGKIVGKKAGNGAIKISCGDISKTVAITVIDIDNVLSKFNEDINCKVTLVINKNMVNTIYNYEFDGKNVKIKYTTDKEYTDLLLYQESIDTYYYCSDLGGGNYSILTEGSSAYNYQLNDILIINLNVLIGKIYQLYDNIAYVSDPVNVAPLIFKEYSDMFTSLTLELEDNLVKNIVGDTVSGCKYSIFITEYDGVSIDVEEYLDNAFVQNELKTIFLNKNMDVEHDNVVFTANPTPNSFDESRGLVFSSNNGNIVLTSASLIDNVTSVTVVVSTYINMNVSIKVGGVSLSVDGKEIVSVSTLVSNNYTIQFTSEAILDGFVEITLSPSSQSSKSMYIKSIGISGKESGLDSSLIPYQVYDVTLLDESNIQDKWKEINNNCGLPSTGSYKVLVIPVQFTDTLITQSDLEKLQKAMNGTSNDTGFESVSSYYYKSSYQKLDLEFTITPIFIASESSTYYKNYKQVYNTSEGTDTQTGDELILIETLTYFEPYYDLSEYDSDSDGIIDAVYLIYQADINYVNPEFYWAYVTNYTTLPSLNRKFDNLEASYYLFAGFEFLDEDTVSGNTVYGKVPGLLINASTLIHETGHLLGLDDYYDYYPDSGSNLGIGGADMMDWTVGDHNSYSKLMLGWIEPTVVTKTSTYTINSFTETGDVLMLLLDYNNSYFCEYLLIELYTNTSLNYVHSQVENSFLYNGASYGVRIFHVSNDISMPFNDSYYSLTTYNNSLSDIPLIKLVQKDGGTTFENRSATIDDLWLQDDVFSDVYESYSRNDGKIVNFDIEFNSVNINNANITITFKK